MRTAIAAMAGMCATMLPLSEAAAQERFRLEKTETGYVRMNTETGAISLCRERSGELVCQVAAEERQAYETEMAELRDRLAALEKRVDALEQTDDPQVGDALEREFEQTMTLMERFFRRFMEIVQGLEQDMEKAPQNEQTAPPERT